MRRLVLLSWLAALPAFSQGWTALSNTSLLSSGVCATGTTGACYAVIEAWSGAVADTSRNRLVFMGGGHGDYNGNEIYAIYPAGTTPVGVACSSTTAPAICRIKNPAGTLRSLGGSCFADTSDGANPNSRHTYQGLAYLANLDTMLVGGGAVACANGNHLGDTWSIPFSTLTWARKDPVNLVGSYKPADVYNGSPLFNGQGPYVHMAYDPVSHLAYREEAGASNGAVANGFIWSYDGSTNTYKQLGGVYTFYDHMTWVVDPVRHRIYMIGNSAGPNGGDATTSLGTAAMRYFDISNTSSYPSTTTDVTSTANSTCSGLMQALNPGLAYDSAIDRIVGWPNFGNTVYLLNPATNTCTTQTFSGGPPDSRDAGGTVSTVGTFGRFQYFPSLDAFLLVNDASNNAYMLKLDNSAAGYNSLTITNTGSTASNQPVQIGRVFAQGEIPSGSLPQASVNGTPVSTQVDVKALWSDGSLKHAIISFLVPTFTSSTTYTITLASGTTVGNTALTQATMLGAGYNFDAVISLTKSGVTKTASARTMLANGDYTVWASGPIATTILLGNHSQGTACSGRAASTYDFGFDIYCPFRPLFEATFWATINKVYVRYIGEVSNTEQLEDLPIDSMTLTAGNTSPATVYTRSTALTMYMGSRWTKTAWIGGTPPVAAINHNLTYLALTKAIPNYDNTKTISSSALTSAYTTWTAASKDLYDAGEWYKVMGNAGGRQDIGPYPSWVVRWLYTGDYRMQEEALGNADLATSWAMHFREGKTGKFLDRAHAVAGIGHAISISTRPSLCLLCGYGYSYTTAADQLIPVGAYTDGGWTPDVAHQPDAFSVPYTLTGDYFYLEQMHFWAAWSAAAPNGAQTTGSNGRGPTGAEGGMPGYGALQTRGQAWGFRSRTQAAFLTPDAMPEQAYFTTLANDAIAIWEGQRSVTGSAYQGTTNWNWGATYHPYGSLGRPPLHHWDIADSSFTQYPADPAVTDISVSTWEQNFVIYALGRAKELGFATDALLTWLGSNLTSQATDSSYNPWLLGAYRLPLTSLATGTYWTNWAGVKSGFDTAAQNATSFGPVYSGGDCTGNASDCYAYFAGAAISMVADKTNGAAAWTWAVNNIENRSALNDEPKWAIVPRSLIAACSLTASGTGPNTVGQSATLAVSASSCGGGTLTYSATGLPTGLGINSTTGSITGTYAAGGAFTPTISVTDGGSNTASVSPSITVNGSPTITTSGTLTAGTQGTAYSRALTTTGGTGTLACAVVAGALPTGLSFSGCTISGTPTTANTYTFTAHATDANGITGATSSSMSITINPSGGTPSNNGGARKGGKLPIGGKINR